MDEKKLKHGNQTIKNTQLMLSITNKFDKRWQEKQKQMKYNENSKTIIKWCESDSSHI